MTSSISQRLFDCWLVRQIYGLATASLVRLCARGRENLKTCSAWLGVSTATDVCLLLCKLLICIV